MHRHFVILTFILFTSCSTVEINLGGRPDRRAITETKPFYILGIVGSHQLIMKDYCKTGVSKIKEQTTFIDALLTGVTFGVYAPRTVNIYCRL